jgi:hypothetical protein
MMAALLLPLRVILLAALAPAVHQALAHLAELAALAALVAVLAALVALALETAPEASAGAIALASALPLVLLAPAALARAAAQALAAARAATAHQRLVARVREPRALAAGAQAASAAAVMAAGRPLDPALSMGFSPLGRTPRWLLSSMDWRYRPMWRCGRRKRYRTDW